MRNRLPFAFLVSCLVVAVVIAGLATLGTALGGDKMTLSKKPDKIDVAAGETIGFTITFHYAADPDENGTTLYIEDDLPSGPGISWTIESSDPPGICEISSTGGQQHLECIGTSVPNPTDTVITVHVTSTTTTASCKEYLNTALAGPPGPVDEHATASINVFCPSPTASPAPTDSPSPTPYQTPSPYWGGNSNWGNVEMQVANNTVHFDAFDAPTADPCAASISGASVAAASQTIDLPGVSLDGSGHFETTSGTTQLSGDISTDGHGFAEGNVTVGIGSQCEETSHFQAEPSDRVFLQGDIVCAWDDNLGTAAIPQGSPSTPTPTATVAPAHPANPNKSITVRDVFEVLKWVAGFAEDSPSMCPLISELLTVVPVPTPVATATPAPAKPMIWGDVNCDSQISAQDALAILMYSSGLEPSGSVCVKVGKFFLSDK